MELYLIVATYVHLDLVRIDLILLFELKYIFAYNELIVISNFGAYLLIIIIIRCLNCIVAHAFRNRYIDMPTYIMNCWAKN